MRNKSFTAAFFSTCLVLFLFLTFPARAAEPVPGGACPTQYLIVTTGGPETTGIRNLMICNGSTWQQLTTWLANGYVGIKTATPAAPLHVNGEVIVGGTTGISCGSTVTGGLRWSSASNTIEMCDGTSWQKIAASTCDNVPAGPVFADQTNLATSNLTNSNIVLVTGMDAACNATVGISGTGGSPQYRVCSDATCSSVDITWTTSNNSVAMQGKYIQLRATSSASVATAFTITASIGPVSSNWVMSTGMSGCTPEGTVCSDGTVYAGLSGASTPMYVTRCDAGQSWSGSACTGTRLTFCWNNCNTTGYVTTSTANTDGQTYTTTLITTDSDSVVGGTQQHIAAQYCADLSQDGHSDWYLPAQNELLTLYNNKTAIGNFVTSGSSYWSSSEGSNTGAWNRRFSDGNQSNLNKSSGLLARCTRR